jgi:DNA-binding HxlR family transcriptional regulator
LERDGLITRTIYPTIPPRVDYELTALGRSLLEPVTGLSAWALKHIGRIELARAKFDAEALRKERKFRDAASVRPTRIEA